MGAGFGVGVFLSDRTGSIQPHRIWLGGGEAKILTDWHGDVSDARPLADGRLVALVATDEPTGEDKRLRAERDDAIVWGEHLRRGRLRLLDLATGEFARRTASGAMSWSCAAAGGQCAGGNQLGQSGKRSGRYHQRAACGRSETGTARDLGRISPRARSPVWWQAGGNWHLAYLARPEPFSGHGGYAVYDVAVTAAAAAHRDLTGGMAACPAGLAQVADGPPLALFANGLDTAIYRLDPGLRRFRSLSTRDGLADSPTASRSGEVIAALASTSCEPVNIHAGPRGGPLIRLNDTQPALRAIRWGTQERLSYQASDGLDLHGLLICHPAKAAPTDRSRSARRTAARCSGSSRARSAATRVPA